jgi:hypothetical protein
MSKPLSFESLQDTAETIGRECREEGSFIVTQHHEGSYSFGTSGMNGDSVPYGLNLAIYYSLHF